jgi:hypothetical protein
MRCCQLVVDFEREGGPRGLNVDCGPKRATVDSIHSSRRRGSLARQSHGRLIDSIGLAEGSRNRLGIEQLWFRLGPFHPTPIFGDCEEIRTKRAPLNINGRLSGSAVVLDQESFEIPLIEMASAGVVIMRVIPHRVGRSDPA